MEPTPAAADLRAQPSVALALELIERAVRELEQQDAELACLHSLLELLLEEPVPFALLEGTVVRGWSLGLEERAGITPDHAIGRSLAKLLDLTPGAPWTDRTGERWRTELVPIADLQVLRFRPWPVDA